MARRLLATYLTITALTLAVVVVPLGRVFADREHDRLTFDIERDAQAVASLVEDALEAGEAPSIGSVLTEYGDAGGRIVVVGLDGISVADSERIGGAPRDFSTRPEIAAALDGRRDSGTRSSETLGSDLMYVALPVASGGTVHGAVRISYPTSTLDARVRATWLRLGTLSVAVLGIVAVVGVVFARGVSRPVRRLEQAAGQLAGGDLTVRVEAGDGPPELRALAQAFNTMAGQLGQLVDSQQRFVADASHQLRTPLTALRLRLETLAPFVADGAGPKLEAAIVETDRLARLVQSLLVLARSDAATAACEPVDLSAAVSRRVDAWATVAEEDAVRLVVDCAPALWAHAVPGAVEQVLDNLLSNAFHAAPHGSEVTVHVRPGRDTVELHVVDQGRGMSDEARRRAFERFWRPAPGPGDSPADGFGLGLAIVEQLVTRSGGSARLDPGPGGVGLDAAITLRAAAAPPGHAAPPVTRGGTSSYPTLTSG